MPTNVYFPDVTTGTNDETYTEQLSDSFNQGVGYLNQELEDSLTQLADDPSNPEYLAEYQAALSAYTLYRNAQSNSVKAMKDLAQAIISNIKS